MPPAFNLSQDQTLQFNTCLFASNSLDDFLQLQPKYPVSQALQSKLLPFIVRALLVSRPSSIPPVTQKNQTSVRLYSAHTYRLYVVKERVRPQRGRTGRAHYTDVQGPVKALWNYIYAGKPCPFGGSKRALENTVPSPQICGRIRPFSRQHARICACPPGRLTSLQR
jgi:hypothetical protein